MIFLQIPTIPEGSPWFLTAIIAVVWLVREWRKDKSSIDLKKAEGDIDCQREVQRLNRKISKLESSMSIMGEYLKEKHKEDPVTQAMFMKLELTLKEE